MKNELTRSTVAVVANALEIGEKVFQELAEGNAGLVQEAMDVFAAELNNELNNRGVPNA